jgi:hypothetical protein
LEIYHREDQLYKDALKFYQAERCATYDGTSRGLRQECSDRNIIIHTSTLSRTLIRVSSGWNSCLYMPCGDLLHAVSSQLQYKIAFLLVVLAFTSYAFNLFKCTKKKSSELFQRKRLACTEKEYIRRIMAEYQDMGGSSVIQTK